MFHNNNKYNFDYPKQYEFVNTTGSLRDERDRFFDCMKQNLETDNFICRYSGVDLGKPAGHLDVVNIEPNNFDSYNNISGLEKYYYNVCMSLPTKMYNSAYYNLVVEGEIDWPHQFIPTEKIVKALVTGIPFVLVGSPLFLQEIRKLGFRTYSELWDESYDAEFDFDKRMNKIIQLCNHLSKFDWEKNKEKLMEISSHNRDLFIQLDKIFQIEYEKQAMAMEKARKESKPTKEDSKK